MYNVTFKVVFGPNERPDKLRALCTSADREVLVTKMSVFLDPVLQNGSRNVDMLSMRCLIMLRRSGGSMENR